jgi:hypothetical protein
MAGRAISGSGYIQGRLIFGFRNDMVRFSVISWTKGIEVSLSCFVELFERIYRSLKECSSLSGWNQTGYFRDRRVICDWGCLVKDD